jgi:phenylacetic acid degradation operon negative regulatory protein
MGFVRLRPDVAIGPYRAGLETEGGLILQASVDQGAAYLPEFVNKLWDLRPLAEAYQSVLARFGPLRDSLDDGGSLAPQDALVMRLLLVDGYRAAILRDPFLPHAALPQDWPGRPARSLFLRLYLQLSVAADSFIQDDFAESEGLILGETSQIAARRASLKAEQNLQTL